MARKSRNVTAGLVVSVALAGTGSPGSRGPDPIVGCPAGPGRDQAPGWRRLPWQTTNSVGGAGLEPDFIDTLVATNTANSSSQRLGAIVHTAIFDAYNGIERRYTPIFVHDPRPAGASRRAAVIAAVYTALLGLFPSRSWRSMTAMRRHSRR